MTEEQDLSSIIDYDAYRDSVANSESKDYGTVNSLGYSGRYQFGAAALEDLGLIKEGYSAKINSQKDQGIVLNDPDAWEIDGGKEAFLKDVELQDAAFKEYTQKNYKDAKKRGFLDDDSEPQKVAGILKGYHLGGARGVERTLSGEDVGDAYGTSVADYIRSGAASQRGKIEDEDIPQEKIGTIEGFKEDFNRSVNNGIFDNLPIEDAEGYMTTLYKKHQGKENIDEQYKKAAANLAEIDSLKFDKSKAWEAGQPAINDEDDLSTQSMKWKQWSNYARSALRTTIPKEKFLLYEDQYNQQLDQIVESKSALAQSMIKAQAEDNLSHQSKFGYGVEVINDLSARFLEGTVSYSSGIIDPIFGDNARENFLNSSLMNATPNPAFDGSDMANIAGALGQGGAQITAALATKGNPLAFVASTAYSFYNNMKSITYDDTYKTVLEQTGDKEAALNAGIEAAPAGLVDSLVDFFVFTKGIKPFGKLATASAKKAAVLKAIKIPSNRKVAAGVFLAGMGELSSEVLQQEYTDKVVGEYTNKPNPINPFDLKTIRQVGLPAFVAGAVGGGIGGAMQRRSAQAFNEALSSDPSIEVENKTTEDVEAKVEENLQDPLDDAKLKEEANKIKEEIQAEVDEGAQKTTQEEPAQEQAAPQESPVEEETDPVTVDEINAEIAKEKTDEPIVVEEPLEEPAKEQKEADTVLENPSIPDNAKPQKKVIKRTKKKTIQKDVVELTNTEDPTSQPFSVYDMSDKDGPSFSAFQWGTGEQPLRQKAFPDRTSAENWAEVNLIQDARQDAGERLATGSFSDSQPSNKPVSPGLVFLAKQFATAGVSFKKLSNVLGTANLKTLKIQLNQAILTNPDQFLKTFAHEIGHLVKGFGNQNRGGVVDGRAAITLGRLANPINNFKTEFFKSLAKGSLKQPELLAKVKDISYQWRPVNSQDPKYLKYRESKDELYADLVSAYLVDPEGMKTNHPEVYGNFISALTTNPEAFDAFANMRSISQNPDSAQAFIRAESSRASKRSIESLKGANKENKQTYKEYLQAFFKSSLITGVHGAKKTVITAGNKRSFLNRHLDRLVSEGKMSQSQRITFQQGLNSLDVLPTSKKLYSNEITRLMEIANQAGITTDDLDNYLTNNRIANETTETIDYILSNPEKTKNALDIFIQAFQSQVGSTQLLTPLVRAVQENLTGQALVDNTASISLLQAAFEQPVKNILKEIKKGQASIPNGAQVYETLNQLLGDGSFNARRFLGNELGQDRAGALLAIDKLAVELGPQRFAVLQAELQEFQEMNFEIVKELHETGVISTKEFKNIERNKNSYAAFGVLKYLERDGRIGASIKQQYGSFEEIGNTFLTTAMKMGAILGKTKKQHATNTVIQISQQVNPASVERITKRENGGTLSPNDLFDERDRLYNNDKENSYEIMYQDGVPQLYKIADPSVTPILNKLTFDQLSKFEQGLKNSQSLYIPFLISKSVSFILKQPFRDIQQQVMRQKLLSPGISSVVPRTLLGIPLPMTKTWNNRAKAKKTAIEAVRFFTGQSVTAPSDIWKYKEGYFPMGSDSTLQGVDRESSAAKSMNDIIDIISNKPVSSLDWSSRTVAPIERFIERKTGIPSYLRSKVNEFLWRALNVNDIAELTAKNAVYLEHLQAKTKELGKTPSAQEQFELERNAANYAMQFGGNPNSGAGGTHRVRINTYITFGQAQINGLEATLNTVKEHGFAKTAAVTMARFPTKILQHPLIGGMVITALAKAGVLDKDEAEKWLRMAEKQTRENRIANTILQLGGIVQTPEGPIYKSMMELTKEEANLVSTKAVNLKIPLTQDGLIYDKIIEHTLDDLGDYLKNHKTLPEAAISSLGGIFSSLLSTTLGGLIPPAEIGVQVLTQRPEKGPIDSFTQAPVFSNEVWQRNDPAEISYEYSKYVLSKFIPVIRYEPKRDVESKQPKSTLETYTRDIPIVSRAVGAFMSVTNFGDTQINQKLKDVESSYKKQFDLQIPKEFLELKKEHDVLKKKASQKSLHKQDSIPSLKGRNDLRTNDEQERYSQLSNWNRRVYEPNRDSWVEGKASGNKEQSRLALEKFDKSSKKYFQ